MHRTANVLAIAPAVSLVLLAYILAPRRGGAGRVRLAVIRAAVAVGAFAVITVEVAGRLGALTPPVFAACWLAGLATAGALAYARWRISRADPRPGPAGPAPLGDRVRTAWHAAGRAERALALTLLALIAGELVVALLAEPNNFDSQTYHLPRIETWVQQHDLEPYPTAIHRQITLAPGAEYLLLHLRLLTGGDALYHLPQWAAGIGCMLAASRIAAQLGGSPRAQLITAFLVGTTPMVVMQSTSTQNDLVVAAWTACVATLALDGWSRRATVGAVLLLGAAAGLTAVSKASGLLAVGPLLVLWAAAQLRLAGNARRAAGVVAASAGVVLVAGALVGPFVARTYAEFGHPLGPPRLRESVPAQRHDPAAVLVNGLRIAHTAWDTPIAPLRRLTAGAIVALADRLGVDPQDRAITFGRETFPVPAWYPDEDRVAFPIQGTLALIGVAAALVRPRRPDAARWLVRGYAGAVLAATVLYAATVKWQPWGNRLLLFALVLATPLAGRWIDARLRRAAAGRLVPPEPPAPAGRPRLVPAVAATVLCVAALAASLSLAYGFPRRLVGSGSVLTSDAWETRFLRRPEWAAEFRWAASAVSAAGARRVGLVQQNDNWEYPWWLLLRDDREIVAMQSVLPNRPPADAAGVDAVVCTGRRAPCERLVPRGWRLEFRGHVGYALPPGQ
jgi:hypothetical protein